MVLVSLFASSFSESGGRGLRSLSAEGPFLQALLVALDHLLDHLAADGTGLTGGQIAVVTFLEVDADFP